MSRPAKRSRSGIAGTQGLDRRYRWPRSGAARGRLTRIAGSDASGYRRGRRSSPRRRSRSAVGTCRRSGADSRETPGAARKIGSVDGSGRPGSAERCLPVCSTRLSYSRAQVWPMSSPPSRTRCSTPARASSREVASPAGPAPTTIASWELVTGGSRTGHTIDSFSRNADLRITLFHGTRISRITFFYGTPISRIAVFHGTRISRQPVFHGTRISRIPRPSAGSDHRRISRSP